MRLKFILLLICSFSVIKNTMAKECVILLHGLARTPASMLFMASYLKNQNYIIINQDYPVTRKEIATMAEINLKDMVSQCQKYNATKINFVTHSLGGIVLRAYLQNNHLDNLGRVVMLAPPNHGSILADKFHNNWVFKQVVGPAGQELTTDSPSIASLNVPINYELGIIAGNFNFNPFLKLFFKEENDGKVSVSSAKLSGMKDFIVLPVSHTFIMTNKVVMQEVNYFLQNGYFSHGKKSS